MLDRCWMINEFPTKQINKQKRKKEHKRIWNERKKKTSNQNAKKNKHHRKNYGRPTEQQTIVHKINRTNRWRKGVVNSSNSKSANNMQLQWLRYTPIKSAPFLWINKNWPRKLFDRWMLPWTRPRPTIWYLQRELQMDNISGCIMFAPIQSMSLLQLLWAFVIAYSFTLSKKKNTPKLMILFESIPLMHLIWHSTRVVSVGAFIILTQQSLLILRFSFLGHKIESAHFMVISIHFGKQCFVDLLSFLYCSGCLSTSNGNSLIRLFNEQTKRKWNEIRSSIENVVET